MRQVIVDTSIWLQVLRRSYAYEERREVAALIEDLRIVMIGPIRQELLSGIQSGQQFEELERCLRSFPDLVITGTDHVQAAVFYNECRAAGIQGSHIDFLICAVAYRHELEIYTSDLDFHRYAKELPILLYLS